MVMKVVKEDMSKILARDEITESTQWLSVKKTVKTTFQCKISPWAISFENDCTFSVLHAISQFHFFLFSLQSYERFGSN